MDAVKGAFIAGDIKYASYRSDVRNESQSTTKKDLAYWT